MSSAETNLVGEEIELIELAERGRRVVARGVCRAATVDTHSNVLVLWLELTRKSGDYYLLNAEIGDVLRIPTDDGGLPKILRIIKR